VASTNGHAHESRRLPSVYIDRWIEAEDTIVRANQRYIAAIEQAEAVFKIEVEQARAQIEHCQKQLRPLVKDGAVRALRGPLGGPELVTLRKTSFGVELFHRHIPDVEELDWPQPIAAEAVADTPSEEEWSPDDVVTVADPTLALD
jgi:hypothetical protein